jgi:hypothetical protein
MKKIIHTLFVRQCLLREDIPTKTAHVLLVSLVIGDLHQYSTQLGMVAHGDFIFVVALCLSSLDFQGEDYRSNLT